MLLEFCVTLKLRLLLLNRLGLQLLMVSSGRRLVVSVTISSLWNRVAVDRARKVPMLMEIVNFQQERGCVLT